MEERALAWRTQYDAILRDLTQQRIAVRDFLNTLRYDDQQYEGLKNYIKLCGEEMAVAEESLKKLEERYPDLDRVTVSLSVGVPLSEALEQLEWFARDVMPAFKGVKVAERAMAN